MTSAKRAYEAQHLFQRHFSSYLHGGLFANRERFLSYPFCPRKICAKYAQDVLEKFRAFQQSADLPDARSPIEQRIAPYRGSHHSIDRLREYLTRNLNDQLVGAYVHGSLATGEEIHYSDFDALLVFRNRIFDSAATLAETCLHVIRAEKILWEYDPLQHHGFFVLTELDLQLYPDFYFPIVIFEYAKSLLPDAGDQLVIYPRPTQERDVWGLHRMLDAVEAKLRSRHYPTNYYDLKLLLSQVMLLPSLYLQALGRPVFKRDSFDLARVDFNEDVWKIMEEVSQMRKEWNYRPSLAARALHRVFPNRFLITLHQKKFGPSLSRDLRQRLSFDFYQSMLDFVCDVREKSCLPPRQPC